MLRKGTVARRSHEISISGTKKLQAKIFYVDILGIICCLLFACRHISSSLVFPTMMNVH